MSRLMAVPEEVLADPHRYRLARAGVFNVWQYDGQIFEFADGRMLLRGANGAGKSKTLEMLLPFVLDGDKRRLSASGGGHHTSLLWLMLENGSFGAPSRIGYVWVEFARTDESGHREVFTCGVGIRASESAKSAPTWFFTSPHAVGDGLDLADGSGPLPPDRCREAVEPDGVYFDQHSGRAYKEHVGRTLFGLEPGRYDELLRMLYWLRRPQVGEDIDPRSLAETLSVALPQLDEELLRSTGESLDQLADFGDQIDNLARATRAVRSFTETYRQYAATVVGERARAVLGAITEQRKRQATLRDREAELAEADEQLTSAENADADAEERQRETGARKTQLESSPEARSQEMLRQKDRRATDLANAASRAERTARDVETEANLLHEDVSTDAGQLGAELATIAGNADKLARRLVDQRVGITLAVPGFEKPMQVTDSERLRTALEDHAARVSECRPAIGTARAAVQVVGEALTESEKAESERQTAEERLNDAEQAANKSAERLQAAEEHASSAEHAFTVQLTTWRTDERAIPFELPEELDTAMLHELPSRARAATEPHLAELRVRQSAASVERQGAEGRLGELREQRAAIEVEPDPAPASPALSRAQRDPATGDPLWRLIDFADQVSAEQAAALEAALESSGLLDAWVRSDGAVLDAHTHDVVLAAGPAASGTTLQEVLTPAPVAESPVSADIVRAVLRRVQLGGTDGEQQVRAGLDGTWRLGPLDGRAGKPVAQYIGVRARTAERARRLAAIDEQIDHNEAILTEAERILEQVGTRIADINAWLAALPPTDELRDAWSQVRSEQAVHTRNREELGIRVDEAKRKRTVAAAAARQLAELAELHGLPSDRVGLTARDSELAALDRQAHDHVGRCRRQHNPLEKWARDRARADTKREQAVQAANDARAARETAAEARTEYETLRDTRGAEVQELERRLRDVERELEQAGADRKAAQEKLRQWSKERGAYEEQVNGARKAVEDHTPILVATLHTFGALHTVEGLLDTVLERPADGAEVAALTTAGAYAPGEAVPQPVQRLARQFTSRAPGQPVRGTTVLGRWNELLGSEAGSTDPRWFEQQEVIVVLGRDQAGEHPISVLAGRLDAKLAADRELFTEREGRIFTEHLLGDLGDALRTHRQEAIELVAAMNRLLNNVSTSQGITVQLAWRLKDDVLPEVREATELLTKPMGALLSEERQRLKDALHQLIETSREEHPELDYAEHLHTALDYREWSEFRVRISRPEAPGDWKDLTRRTPLSQGEQKVVCYLPLFAAASAHFTGIAGASAYAPQFILLDDAFPKIDVKTHPKLFGLLVDFDLDFVITSERLWGDYETVPKLAIYEALRSPTERGIAQYKHLWDGRRLRAVGMQSV
ncbi:TIGR02680 family protein [Sciscionella marina]|uniref:TIGR02680 family protein n=1 Tax=Sciscionella marina TaxID=508770 RepID=UPI00059119D4|nr:TIGR02680 family protein [Sciscionella marina]